MNRGNVIEVAESKGEKVIVDKIMKSVSLYKCAGEKGSYAKFEVNGKCNSVSIDTCSGIEVEMDTVMSTVEVTNSKRIKINVRPGNTILAVMIDKTDGCLVTLSDETAANPDFQIIASKSSEMNIAFTNNGEQIEKPIPEQFVFKIDKSEGDPKVVAAVSDLYSS